MNYGSYFLFVISFCTIVSAYGSNSISGAGGLSCGSWIEYREIKSDDLNKMLGSWFQGFVAGMNTQLVISTKKQMVETPDYPTLLAYVDKECKDNPLDNVYSISIRLYRDIQKKQ